MSAIQLSSFCLASASITGPTWVDGSRGSPIFSSRAAPMSMSSIGSAMSSCKHRSRSAEQRWPVERNADVITSSITCSGSAVASTIMALMPPVSAISGTIGPSLAASAWLIARPTSVEPVKQTPAVRGVGDESGADRAVAGHEMERGRRHAGLMQERHRAGGNERRLFRRLRHDRIAGGERAAHLAEKDRQRKIPRADADEHAASAIAQHVAFAGRSGSGCALKPCAPAPRSSGNNRPPRAHSASASSSVLPPSICSSARSWPRSGFEQAGGALERRGALLAWRRRPSAESPPRPPPSPRARSPRRPRAPRRQRGRRSAKLRGVRCRAGRCRRPKARLRWRLLSPLRTSASSASRLARSPNSMPAELCRSGR